MNILLLTSHSIAEHDDLQMFSRMPGIEVFSIGAYTDPHHPGDDKRPPVVEAVHHTGLQGAVEASRARLEHDLGAPGHYIDWAKARLDPQVLDWADTIIVHHFPEQWIKSQWDAIRNHRVIWRTCGQSDPRIEREMSALRRDGLQIVRYSPAEERAFLRMGSFAGSDALIRFGKDPDVWRGWTGEIKEVGNITQHMAQRGDACGHGFWASATRDLPTRPAGPGSEALKGGIGALSYDGMHDYLRSIGAYLYTGTRPASYTLGLIEALMTGVPTVVMGRGWFEPPLLWEAGELAKNEVNSPAEANALLMRYLADHSLATAVSVLQRHHAIKTFDLKKVSRDWAEFLGTPRPYTGDEYATVDWAA